MKQPVQDTPLINNRKTRRDISALQTRLTDLTSRLIWLAERVAILEVQIAPKARRSR